MEAAKTQRWRGDRIPHLPKPIPAYTKAQPEWERDQWMKSSRKRAASGSKDKWKKEDDEAWPNEKAGWKECDGRWTWNRETEQVAQRVPENQGGGKDSERWPNGKAGWTGWDGVWLLYTTPSPRDP